MWNTSLAFTFYVSHYRHINVCLWIIDLPYKEGTTTRMKQTRNIIQEKAMKKKIERPSETGILKPPDA